MVVEKRRIVIGVVHPVTLQAAKSPSILFYESPRGGVEKTPFVCCGASVLRWNTTLISRKWASELLAT